MQEQEEIIEDKQTIINELNNKVQSLENEIHRLDNSQSVFTWVDAVSGLVGRLEADF